MFKTSITSTPFTSEAANSFFQNIKANREYAKEFGEKKQKGRHASAKRGARTKLQLMEDDYGFVEGI